MGPTPSRRTPWTLSNAAIFSADLTTPASAAIVKQMAFDPKIEPCSLCGREPDECVCGLAPDLPVTLSGVWEDTSDLDFYSEDWAEDSDER